MTTERLRIRDIAVMARSTDDNKLKYTIFVLGKFKRLKKYCSFISCEDLNSKEILKKLNQRIKEKTHD